MIRSKIINPISLGLFNVLVSLFIVIFFNIPLWTFLYQLKTIHNLFPFSFLLVFFIILSCFFYFIISLFSLPYIHKLILSTVLISGSLAQYFMLKYGILIDSAMISNVLETNFYELSELFTFNMIIIIVFLGIIPSLVMYKCNIQYPNNIRNYLRFFIFNFLVLIILIILILFQYKTFASVFRNHKDIILRIIPNNYFYGIYQNMILTIPPKTTQINLNDANKHIDWAKHERNTIFILIIGEAARASNFSLNGYKKETNPYLKYHDVFSFNNFYSCGTNTSTSVPCIFSSLTRSTFNKEKFQYHDNLLHLIEKSGFYILWIDNNSGCKSVCNPLQTIKMQDYLSSNCNQEIYDEEMLPILKNFINSNNDKDLFIVLHQKGSHGPAYYKRVPDKFHVFIPICNSVELQKCSTRKILNSYDNTILYTDYFLSEIIKVLKKASNRNTGMMYISDHGQSLGENGIYLHGMPYLLAPNNQKHIPMIMWLSSNFTQEFDIDQLCIHQLLNNQFSHDNIFHTILSLLKINTKNKDHSLNLLKDCIQ